MTGKEHVANFQAVSPKSRRYVPQGPKAFSVGRRDDFEVANVTFHNADKIFYGWNNLFLLANGTIEHLIPGHSAQVITGERDTVVVVDRLHANVPLGISWADLSRIYLSRTVSTYVRELPRSKFVEIGGDELGSAIVAWEPMELAFSVFASSPNLGESTLRSFVEPEEASTWTQRRPTRFVPSEQLVSFTERGVQSLIEAAAEAQTQTPNFPISEKPTREELTQSISVRLERMLSTLGKRARQEGHAQLPISETGRFKLSVQYEILDRLPVRPDEGGEFFAHLYSEIVSFLHMGGHLGGAWGEVAERANDLYLMIKPATAIAEESWEPAGDLEGDVPVQA